MINNFLLAYQGFDYFREKFDKKKYPSTKLRIIDNGNQKIEGYETYTTKNNITYKYTTRSMYIDISM